MLLFPCRQETECRLLRALGTGSVSLPQSCLEVHHPHARPVIGYLGTAIHHSRSPKKCSRLQTHPVFGSCNSWQPSQHETVFRLHKLHRKEVKATLQDCWMESVSSGLLFEPRASLGAPENAHCVSQLCTHCRLHWVCAAKGRSDVQGRGVPPLVWEVWVRERDLWGSLWYSEGGCQWVFQAAVTGHAPNGCTCGLVCAHERHWLMGDFSKAGGDYWSLTCRSCACILHVCFTPAREWSHLFNACLLYSQSLLL